MAPPPGVPSLGLGLGGSLKVPKNDEARDDDEKNASGPGTVEESQRAAPSSRRETTTQHDDDHHDHDDHDEPAETAPKPSLSLGSDSSDDDSSDLDDVALCEPSTRTSNQRKPALPALQGAGPGLSLRMPTSTTEPETRPVSTAAPTPALAVPRTQAEEPNAKTAQQQTVYVDLLSNGLPALTVPGGSAGNDAILEHVRTYCEANLGVRGDDVELFDVNPVSGNQATTPGGARHVALRVRRSDFSLTALEYLLAEKRSLADNLAKVSGALASLQTSVKEQFEAAADARAGAKSHESASQRWRTRAEELERENATLREQLRRSDALRAQGHQSLEALRAEFEALTRDLANEQSWTGAASMPGARR